MIKTSGFKVYKVQSRLKYCYWDESVLWREKATGGNIVSIPAFDVIHRSIKRRLGLVVSSFPVLMSINRCAAWPGGWGGIKMLPPVIFRPLKRAQTAKGIF